MYVLRCKPLSGVHLVEANAGRAEARVVVNIAEGLCVQSTRRFLPA